jgi:2'-5' RNA ligase
MEMAMSRTQFEFDLTGGGGNNPPPAPKSRIDLFVGLQAPATAAGQAAEIAGDFMRRLGVAEEIRPPHVTLHGLGMHSRFSLMDLAAKKEELSSVAVEPFMLTFDQIMSFQRPHDKKALVLCCSQPNRYLIELQRNIADAQRQPGIDNESTQAFTPHLTLFYTDQMIMRQSLETPVRWLVRDFHIIWSHTGECRHESLWQWPPLA